MQVRFLLGTLIIYRIMNKEERQYFNKKLRVEMLGVTSSVPQSKLIQLCEKFFLLGIDYQKNQK